MTIKNILIKAENMLPDDYLEAKLMCSSIFICNNIHSLLDYKTITKKEHTRVLTYLHKHRPTANTYVKFYEHQFYYKPDEIHDRDSWWMITAYTIDEVIEQKRLYLNLLISRL